MNAHDSSPSGPVTPGGRLSRVVERAQALLAEVLRPGDLAIDLTAGTGRDTFFLWRQVGPAGRVLSFDIQREALDATAALLRSTGTSPHLLSPGQPLSAQAGVVLIHANHVTLAQYLRGQNAPRAMVANLGYLPGGDPNIVTEAATTCAALRQALELLAPGGRLAVVLYAGHPGGAEEAAAVQALFRSLPPQRWQVLHLEVANRPAAPSMLLAEKSLPAR